jgi:butyrate kinase
MLTQPILILNPGSTSTKLALADGAARVAREEVPVAAHAHCAGGGHGGAPGSNGGACSTCDASGSHRRELQIESRYEQALEFLQAYAIAHSELAAIAARGGPLRPVPGGVYRVNEAMLSDAAGPEFVDHASRLACLVAARIAGELPIPCFVVDPISTDEFDDVARVSGLKALARKSLTHALNMKRAARRFAAEADCTYQSLNLITAHLGGGITIAAHRGGRMVDSVDSNGEGPMSPQRSGGLRADDLTALAIESGQGAPEFVRGLTRDGGLLSHLGTSDVRQIERRIRAGGAHSEHILRALAYQVAKHIAALSVPLGGDVGAIILTGGMAHSELVTGWIGGYVRHIAPVIIYAGEFEMEALAEGAARALAGKERVRCYPSGNFE